MRSASHNWVVRCVAIVAALLLPSSAHAYGYYDYGGWWAGYHGGGYQYQPHYAPRPYYSTYQYARPYYQPQRYVSPYAGYRYAPRHDYVQPHYRYYAPPRQYWGNSGRYPMHGRWW